MKEQIKQDYTTGIIPLVKRTILYIGGSYILLGFLPFILIMTFYLWTLGQKFLQFMEETSVKELEQLRQTLEEDPSFLVDLLPVTESLIYWSVAGLVMFLLQAWLVVVCMRLVRNEVEEVQQSFGQVIASQFSDVLTTAGYFLLIAGGTLLYGFLLGLLFTLHPLLYILGVLVYGFLLIKFLLGFPAITIKRLNAIEALAYSWRQLPSKTALGLYLGAIVMMIIYFIVTAIVLLIVMLLPETLGTIIDTIYLIAMNAFLLSLVFGTLTSVYYHFEWQAEK